MDLFWTIIKIYLGAAATAGTLLGLLIIFIYIRTKPEPTAVQ